MSRKDSNKPQMYN